MLHESNIQLDPADNVIPLRGHERDADPDAPWSREENERRRVAMADHPIMFGVAVPALVAEVVATDGVKTDRLSGDNVTLLHGTGFKVHPKTERILTAEQIEVLMDLALADGYSTQHTSDPNEALAASTTLPTGRAVTPFPIDRIK
jgi:hypothetical protein